MSAFLIRLSSRTYQYSVKPFSTTSLAAVVSSLPAFNISSKLCAAQYPLLHVRHIATTPASFLKEIIQNIEGNKITVEAKFVESPNTKLLIKNPLADQNVCPLCALNLNLKHTDVLVLSQFVRSNGQLLPRRITGLCCSQQYKLTMLVTMAKKAGLMPNLGPANSHKDPAMRRGSKKYNRYFDESTISDTRLRNIARYKDISFQPYIGPVSLQKQ